MSDIKIVDLKKTILDDNDADAETLRNETKQGGFSYLNVMSSPGSGKTTTILAVLDALKNHLHCGVLEADIDSDVDARAVLEAGYPCVQLHTGGMCHLDAQMSRQAIMELFNQFGSKTPELVILENVGNLVCPAEFDTGADLNVVILSVPEGDDKPLKYPLVFSKCDTVIVNKMDSLPAFDFDLEKFTKAVKARNSGIRIFPISARNREGIDELAGWIAQHVEKRNGIHEFQSTGN